MTILLEKENQDSDMELDTDWIQEQEKMHKINQNYCEEPMETIDIFFMYINIHSYIEKIVCEKHSLDSLSDKTCVLKKENMIRLIQSKKISTIHSKYKLMDILVYNIDLEPHHIQNYSKSENILDNSRGFFKVLPIIDDIKISPSIFIFHSINSIFVLFKEHEKYGVDGLNPKSILKSNENNNHKVTKKVRLCLNKTKSKRFRR